LSGTPIEPFPPKPVQPRPSWRRPAAFTDFEYPNTASFIELKGTVRRRSPRRHPHRNTGRRSCPAGGAAGRPARPGMPARSGASRTAGGALGQLGRGLPGRRPRQHTARPASHPAGGPGGRKPLPDALLDAIITRGTGTRHTNTGRHDLPQRCLLTAVHRARLPARVAVPPPPLPGIKSGMRSIRNEQVTAHLGKRLILAMVYVCAVGDRHPGGCNRLRIISVR